MYSSNPVIGKLNLSFKIKKNRGREWPIFQKIMILKNCLIEDLSPGTLVFDGTALTTLPQSRHLLFFLFCFWSRLLNNLIHFSVASDNWLFFNLIFRPLRWSLRPLIVGASGRCYKHLLTGYVDHAKAKDYWNVFMMRSMPKSKNENRLHFQAKIYSKRFDRF